MIRTAIALVFAVPAAMAGYHAALGLAQLGVPAELWQQAFAVIGPVAVGTTAGARLAPLIPPRTGRCCRCQVSVSCSTCGLEFAELLNEPWTLVTPESLGRVAIGAFRASGLDYPHATVVSNSPEVRLSLVAAGRFLTIAPSSLLRLRTGRAELKALPVELPLAIGPIGIVTLKNRTLGPVARVFIEHAREVAKPLAKGK